MRLAASKGIKIAADWIRENIQYIKLNHHGNQKGSPEKQLSLGFGYKNSVIASNLGLVLLNNT